MKATLLLTVILFFVLNLGKDEVSAQVVAVGRVSAEIVESVSVASSTVADFELVKADYVSAGVNPTPEMLNLGAITINTGKNITCNIVLTSASLSDEAGNNFTIDTSVKNNTASAPVSGNGIQTIKLGATPALSGNQAPGLYEGSYTVIFAYN